MLFSLSKTKIAAENSSFIFLFIIGFSLFVYNWYILKSQVAAMYLVNQQLQTDLKILNSKCLELDSALSVFQSKKNSLVPITHVLTNNSSNLDLTNILWYGSCLFVFALVVATAYSFCVDNTSFLDTAAGQNFIDKNSIVVTPLQLQNAKYELLTKIDYKASTVAHWIKKGDQSDMCAMPLEEFISIYETSSSSAFQSSLDAETIECGIKSLEYLSSLG